MTRIHNCPCCKTMFTDPVKPRKVDKQKKLDDLRHQLHFSKQSVETALDSYYSALDSLKHGDYLHDLLDKKRRRKVFLESVKEAQEKFKDWKAEAWHTASLEARCFDLEDEIKRES